MMVPRSFLHTSPSSAPSPRQNKNEKDEGLLKPQDPSGTRTAEGTGILRKPARISMVPPPKPSRPVVIPTRTKVAVQHQMKEKPREPRTELEENDRSHNPLLLPLSVSALLAITSLPKSKHHSHAPIGSRNGNHLDTCPQECVGTSIHTFSNFSSQTWEALLSSPNEPEHDSSSITSDGTLDPLSVRSFSGESMPSLETDLDSSGSLSTPSTPAISIPRRYAADRRPKKLTPSLSQECLLEHPLLLIPVDIGCGPEFEPVPEIDCVKTHTIETQPSVASKSLFKSNLSASLRMLRSAAVSFSNFTTPILQRDDYLASSLLSMSPQLTDERRPLPSTDIPNPALRRYLNPTVISPAELYFHQSQSSWNQCTASIQMQPVHRAVRRSQKATAPPVFASYPLSPLSSELHTASFSRQREPRENSDFLRVIVLEMNMRKKGKLADTAPGRARLWLPPRQGLIQSEVEEAGIPKRWIGVVL